MMQTSPSPAGTALNLGAVETEEQKRKRLAALSASQRSISQNLGTAGALSPAGQYLAGGF